MPPPPTFNVRLAYARMLSPLVRELHFERLDENGTLIPIEFTAGQWISLVLPLPEGDARRAYSIASPPNGSPTFEVAVTKVSGGAGSSYLHELPEGAMLRATGPQGLFTRTKYEGLTSLFVGTGTGVTPLRSMIKSALANGETSSMTLLFGVRHLSDQLYREEFEALAAQHSNFRVFYTISQPEGAWHGRTGYVQDHIRELWAELGDAPHIYVCGLQRMVTAVRELLKHELGVDRKQVHTERYD
jgi:ferredoxin-NADP reductase